MFNNHKKACKFTQKYANVQEIPYFCSDFQQILDKVRRFLYIFAVLGLVSMLFSCHRKQEPVVTPYGSVLDSVTVEEDFDLSDIQTNGELIIATVTGPETYYDYHGKQLGTQYLICQRFADSLGVRLRVDVCRDSAEMVRKLQEGEVDMVAWQTPGRIDVGEAKPESVAHRRGEEGGDGPAHHEEGASPYLLTDARQGQGHHLALRPTLHDLQP